MPILKMPVNSLLPRIPAQSHKSFPPKAGRIYAENAGEAETGNAGEQPVEE
jgi:hypothetical protein